MPGGRRKLAVRPQWSDVRGLLHMRLKDAAAELNVSTTYLRRFCRQNGLPEWPGKKIRHMETLGKTMMIMEVGARQSSPSAGLAGPSQPANTVETREEEDMIRIHEPDVNHPPGELTTLNLIDKVGLSPDST